MDRDFDVDKLLYDIFREDRLLDFFNATLKELDIPATSALKILDMEYRALQSILYGENKKIDFENLLKLASFLRLPKEKVIFLYLNDLERNLSGIQAYPQAKIDFINKNFDLATLRKAQFIDNITDYKEIEIKINKRLGLNSITEYMVPARSIAYSAGVIKPRNDQTREFWVSQAMVAFKAIENPYSYNRKGLLEYIPRLRSQSTNVEKGLLYAIGDLFKLGVTVYYQTSFPELHLRGGTMVINQKPCIILTDYRGFYPTLWYALVHELFHVLFHLDEIEASKYHLSNESPQNTSEDVKEKEADDFAREYLFSKVKSESVKPHINNKNFVFKFALENQVHPSFIYVFHAYDTGGGDLKAWSRAKQNNPDFNSIKKILEMENADSRSISEHIECLKNDNIYK